MKSQLWQYRVCFLLHIQKWIEVYCIQNIIICLHQNEINFLFLFLIIDHLLVKEWPESSSEEISHSFAGGILSLCFCSLRLCDLHPLTELSSVIRRIVFGVIQVVIHSSRHCHGSMDLLNFLVILLGYIKVLLEFRI